MINDDATGRWQSYPSIATDIHGNVYIVWQDMRNWDNDIYFSKSSDGGVTFSTNKMINDDGGSTEQTEPSIAADNYGNVFIVWKDERNGNTDIFFASSSDWGDTFSVNKMINDDGSTFKQDDPAIADDNRGNVFITWQDDRNRNYDVFFATTLF